MRFALAVAAAALLAGCTVGEPSGLVARGNHTCADATRRISALEAPHDPRTALAYALDRYVTVEHAVSELTDSSPPRDLGTRWLRPARASLRAGDHSLRRLRDASRNGDRAGAAAAFPSAAAAGTAGVDTDLLRARKLTRCATLFTPSVPPVSW